MCKYLCSHKGLHTTIWARRGLVSLNRAGLSTQPATPRSAPCALTARMIVKRDSDRTDLLRRRRSWQWARTLGMACHLCSCSSTREGKTLILVLVDTDNLVKTLLADHISSRAPEHHRGHTCTGISSMWARASNALQCSTRSASSTCQTYC